MQKMATSSTTITEIKQQLLLSSNNFIIFLLTRPMLRVFSSIPRSSYYAIILIKYIQGSILLI